MYVKLRLQILIALSSGLLGFFTSSPAAANLQCRAVLLSSELGITTPEAVEGVLMDLAKMKLELDLEKMQGPEQIEISAMSSIYSQREKALFDFLADNKILNRTQAQLKMRELIAGLQNRRFEKQKQDQTQKSHQQDSLKDILVMEGSLKMHPIDPSDKFEKQFWMSTTAVTQRQWAMIAALFPGDIHENPSVHDIKNGNSQIIALPDGSNRKMQPENPVEYVNAVQDKSDNDYYMSAYNFIEKLNQLSKLDDPVIYQLVVGHQKGMIYSLPSEAQYEYVATDLGKSKGPNATKLFEYAHIKSNYGTGTVPVASFKPFEVAGGKFYDLLGNVGTLTSTTNAKGNLVTVKGGSYMSDNKIKISSRNKVEINAQSETVGIRLIGTLP